MAGYSAEYAAPEQFDAEFGSADTYTDVYQLSAVVYTMLTGRPPYTGGHAEIMHEVLYGDAPTPPSSLSDGIPNEIDEIVSTALSHSKRDRFRGEAGKVADRLRSVRTDGARSAVGSAASTTPATEANRRSSDPPEPTSSQTVAPSDTTNEPGSWPMFGQNSARRGSVRNAEQTRDDTNTQPAGTERWHYDIDATVRAPPAVANDTVYVGSDDNNLYALDAATGEKHWEYETNDSVQSQPAVVGGVVYVGSKDCVLYALDAATGEKYWDYVARGEIVSSPAVVDDTVYFSSYDSNLYALDAATGDEYWRETCAEPRSSSAVSTDTVYIGGSDGLYALDAATGEQQWVYETDPSIDSSPVVADGTVYVGNIGDSYALNATTGERHWRAEMIGVATRGSPVVADETVYIAKAELRALVATTSETRWEHESRNRSSSAVIDDTVYATNSDGLHALDATTGESRWQCQIEGELSSPAVDDDTVYLTSKDGDIYAIARE